MFIIFLLCGLVFILCSLAPPIMSFSHGASHASCREMIPGHIRAHPLDPQHSYVVLRTSAPSYLPGQLITVTVRSSRDFMGFLLQARSTEITKSSAGGRAGTKSTRLGFLLVRGSWILTPPGTHTLHCFSEDDTVTHSDKQRKRNLSFLWRAPDTPIGDVQFHITVVQSYFVYWAGIESAVVRDGSRRAWRGSNSTVVYGESTAFVFQEEKATSLQGLIAHRASKKQGNRTANPVTTLNQWTKAKSRSQITKSLKTFTDNNQPAWKSTSSVTLSNQKTTKRKNTLTFGSRQSDTDTTPASLLGVGSVGSVSNTKDPKSYLPFKTSTFPFDIRRTTHFPNTTEQISVSPLSPVNSPIPFFSPSYLGTEVKEPTTNSLETKLNTDPELKNTTVTIKTTTTKLTIHDFHHTNTPTTTEQRRPGELETKTRPQQLNRVIPTESLMSTIQAKTHSRTPSSKQSHSDRSEVSLYSQWPLKLPTLSPKLVLSSNSPSLKSFPTSFLIPAELQYDNSPSGPKSTPKQAYWSQTTTPLNNTLLSQTLSSFRRSVTETVPAQDEALSQSYVPPQLVNTLYLSSKFGPVFTVEKELNSQSTIKTLSHFHGFVPTATSSPSFSTFAFESSPSPSTASFHTTSLVHPSVEPPVHPSVRSLSLTHSSSTFQSKPQTTPALSAVPSPAPISTPPQLSSAQPSSSSPLLSLFTFSAISSTNTSHYPSQVTFSSAPGSTLPPFNSSQCITNPTATSPSSSTMAPAITSSSLATSTSAPSFFSPTTSSAFNEGLTSPDQGPSHAPHQSVQTTPTSSVSTHKITVGQMLLIKTHITPHYPGPNFNPPTQRTVVHPNPKPHPNLRLNHGQDFKPKIVSVDTKPSNPVETPNKEGKYPEIIPRHSSWELGMLLGCSTGLGMVLVIGVRYVYRQACGRRTEVTLNDREREYERGERGLIQIQECGDLVRVRKIRENSFVLLAEYDVLASPGH